MAQYKIIGKAQTPQTTNSGYKIIGRAKTDEPEEEFPEIEEESTLGKLPRNIGIGLLNLSRDVLNTPYDVIKRGEELSTDFNQKINKNALLPEGLKGMMGANKPSNFSEKVWHLPETNYAQMLGQKGEGTFLDKLIQGGVQYAPELLTGRAIYKAATSKFPFTQRMAGKKLKTLEKKILKSNVPNIPISPELLEESQQFLPKSRATTEMLKGADRGEYKPSFALQSQIGKHERDLAKSFLPADRLLAPTARDLKLRTLEEMTEGLKKHGYADLADELIKGIGDYKTYIKIREKIHPMLRSLGIPTTGLSIVGLGLNKARKKLGD